MPKKSRTTVESTPATTAGSLYALEVFEHAKGGFGIKVDGKEMLLPRKQPFWTPSRAYAERTLEILAQGGPEHFDKNRALVCHACTLFVDFSSGIAAPGSKELSAFKRNPGYWATFDPIHALCAGPEVVDQLAALSPFLSFCSDRGIARPNWPQCGLDRPNNTTDFREIVKANSHEDSVPDLLRYFETLEREFRQLSQAQVAVMHTYLSFGCCHGGAPFVLTLLLVKGLCSPAEFAEGFLATLCIIPRVFGDVSTAEYKREFTKLKRDAERALFFLKHH